MCGRYAIYDQLNKSELSLLGQNIPVNFNVAPTSNVPIIRTNTETNEQQLYFVRWGLIPHWAKSLKTPPFFNARADNLPGNKVFWPSINRRCLIPMTGFYEWAEQDKQPYYIYAPQKPVLFLAGVWNQWQSDDGQIIESCVIITTKPNKVLADIHHRMPVILLKKDYQAWLHDSFEQAKNLLCPYTDTLTKYPVNPKVVNNARNNSILCLEKQINNTN